MDSQTAWWSEQPLLPLTWLWRCLEDADRCCMHVEMLLNRRLDQGERVLGRLGRGLHPRCLYCVGVDEERQSVIKKQETSKTNATTAVLLSECHPPLNNSPKSGERTARLPSLPSELLWRRRNAGNAMGFRCKDWLWWGCRNPLALALGLNRQDPCSPQKRSGEMTLCTSFVFVPGFLFRPVTR
jgi:hypothetical protein